LRESLFRREELQSVRGLAGLSSQPFVSVIIPTYERVECLLHVLDGLKRQSYRNFEIVVVDQSRTNDVAKERAYTSFGRKLRVVRSQLPNRSFAKNLGARYAQGDILLFCDDDIEVPPDLVHTHVSAYSDGSVGAVSCRVTEQGLPSLKTKRILRITWYGQMLAGFQSNVTCFVKSLVGANMSVLQSVWGSVGEFDQSYGGTSIFEEPDFSARVRLIGYKILFTNATAVRHFPQKDGNDDQKSQAAAAYYRSFHHNEVHYFLKNQSRLTLFAVIPFCALRTLKQSFRLQFGLQESFLVFKGVFDGFKTYYGLYR
jgi:GT2 family glycosyltransferase